VTGLHPENLARPTGLIRRLRRLTPSGRTHFIRASVGSLRSPRIEPIGSILLAGGKCKRPHKGAFAFSGAPDRMGAPLRGDACRRFAPRCEPSPFGRYGSNLAYKPN
jgi:hypothetical protein